MKIFPVAVFICLSLFSQAQNPLVKAWDARFGGSGSDMVYGFQQTADGGYLLGGWSSSPASGDKSQASRGFDDYWIVKIDSSGIKQWDKRFGGNDYDELYAAHQTSDHGYILGGFSYSGSNGDKTQARWGGDDYWVVKTDSAGIKQWDKVFGGTDFDELFSLVQTNNGGYLLGGWSSSLVNGDKTQASRGGYDFWIVRLSAAGVKQWDRAYGGTGYDALYSIQRTADNGFILGGASYSGISGEKSQPCQGGWDYWIVKIDSAGNKLWDKTYGGSGDDYLTYLLQADDHGYVLAGYSSSGISGDKTQNTKGGSDYWIIRTDSLGNKLWDVDLGGTLDEIGLGNVAATTDGGFLVAGSSESAAGGDKSENNLGPIQTWIVKIDSAGGKIWDKTVFTTGSDLAGFVRQSFDGCIAVSNYSNSGIGGDKTQANRDTNNITTDFWIAKYCEMLQANFTAPDACPGTCLTFTNLSNNGTAFQWSFPGATPDTSTAINPVNICYNSPGDYDVTLVASNAGGSDTLTLINFITVYPYPPAQGIVQSSDTLFANQGAIGYQWYINGNLVSGATDYFYVAAQSGNFNVVAIDSNGCEVEAVIFDVVAGVSAVAGTGGVILSPNPATDYIEIVSPLFISGEIEIVVRNTVGENVITSAHRKLDVGKLAHGMYFVEGVSGGKNFRARFVKQ
jgi:hypothetical protein